MFYSIEFAKSAVTRNTIKVSCRQRRKKSFDLVYHSK